MSMKYDVNLYLFYEFGLDTEGADFPTPHLRVFKFDIMLRHEHELRDQNDRAFGISGNNV